MSNRRNAFQRTTCPACRQSVCRNASGKFRHHGPKRSPCDGTGRNVIEAVGRTPGNTFSGEQIAVMNIAYCTGDWVPVERAMGVTFPRYVIDPELDADQALAHLVGCIRSWLEQLATTGMSDVKKAHSA